MELIRISVDKSYECKKLWPEDCSAKYGAEFMEIDTKNLKDSFTTAYFEAFLKNPNTFVRGKGKTIEEAEKDAFAEYEKIINCPGHEFERRDYTNGAGICKHCGMFNSKAFEPIAKCCKCGKPTNWATDQDNNIYCENCYCLMPEIDLLKWWNEWRKTSWLQRTKKIANIIYLNNLLQMTIVRERLKRLLKGKKF